MTARASRKKAAQVTPASTALATASRAAVERRASGMKTSGSVIPELPLWAQMLRIGGSLTPQQVSNYIREADGGRMAPLIDLANEARQKDGHLQSILSTSEEAISGLDWELVLPEKPKLKEKKLAEWMDAQLRLTPSFRRLLAHQAGAVYYGYAVTEIEWMNAGGRLAPRCFRPISPRRFAFDMTSSVLCWWDAIGTMANPVDFYAAYPDRFIVSQPRVNGDVPCREGLVRVLVWAALFRNWGLSDWLKLAEIAWKPWRTGTYEKTTSDDSEAQDLLAILEIMSSTGVAVVPKTATIDVQWPKSGGGSTSNHHELLSMLASEMSKAVLGQTLTTEQTRVGSQALGNVHNEVRKDLRDARAAAVASDIDRDIIGPMARLNAGDGTRPPTFRFLTEDPTDLVQFATGVKLLVDAGAKISQEWVRQEAGIPEPDDDDELLQPGGAQAPEAEEGAQGPASQGAQEAKPTGDKGADA